jgi:hypothetical protein
MIGRHSLELRIATVASRDRTEFNGTERSIDTVLRKGKGTAAYVVLLHRAVTSRRGKIAEDTEVRFNSHRVLDLGVVLGEARAEN